MAIKMSLLKIIFLVLVLSFTISCEERTVDPVSDEKSTEADPEFSHEADDNDDMDLSPEDENLKIRNFKVDEGGKLVDGLQDEELDDADGTDSLPQQTPDKGDSEDDPIIINGKTESQSSVKEENGVLVLTTKNFDEVVEKENIILVEFYAPWCGHCKSLAPEYEKAAEQMKKSDPPVPLAKVDATEEEDLGKRFEIQGYPTLKIFRNGKASNYDGPRKAEGIVKYLKEQADPNWKPPPEEVIVLSKDNFTEIINKEELMLVEFYAPWCGHCKTLAPQYEKAAKQLKSRDTPILLAKVDATLEPDIAKKYDVTGYPTLKVFRNGRPSDYKGERNEQGIVGYMESQEGPSSKLKETLKDVKDFIKSALFSDTVILGFFKDKDDPMLQAYLDANNDIRDDYSFGHTFNQGAKDMLGVKKSSVIVIHAEHLRSKYDPKHESFTNEKAVPSDFVEFYKKHESPLVGHIQSHTEKKFSKRPLVVVYYDVNFSHEYKSMTQYWHKKIADVANDYPDVQFAVGDEESYAEKLKELGLSDSGEDINVGMFADHDLKYAMQEEFSQEALRDFIQAYRDGDLKPILKSQAPPEKNTGPVKTVVGNTFDQIVMDESKDVLIEFYAPWCGHCKSLEPIFKKLGQKYANEKNLVIAKLDSTANDSPPEYKVEGFPTIYFAPPGKKKEPLKYSGDRTLEGFTKYLEEHATVSMKKTKKDEL